MKTWVKVALSIVALVGACRLGVEIERARENARKATAPNILRNFSGAHYYSELDRPRFLTDEPYPP